MESLLLLGLDFGSTTCSAMVASARVVRNCTTGRMELGHSSIIYRSALALTPFAEDQIEEGAMAELLDHWIEESRVDPSAFASGGAIITGLAAKKGNTASIEALVKHRVSDALFATADDPCLESWLAFMGSCLGLSRAQPESYFLNLDIGGGTTNLALGINGDVLRTGCLLAGARHFQFVPGTYRIAGLSAYAARLLGDLGIQGIIGKSLSPEEIRRILDFYTDLIEAAVVGDRSRLDQESFRYHEQVPFTFPREAATPVITFSGGVGALIYNQVRGGPPTATTAFGDFGGELAQRLIQSSVLSRDLRTHVPENLGHATVCGLSLHGTEVSGTTLYLPDPGVLPLRDLPVVARVHMDASADDVAPVVALARRATRGACIEIEDGMVDFAAVKRLGSNLAAALGQTPFPTGCPLVLFVPRNIGKTLGAYASDWGRLPVKLIVIDEMASRNARFASVGAPRNNVVPVSFFGMHEVNKGLL